MRPTTRALVQHYVDALDLWGDVLEIGGHRLAKCAVQEFPAPRFAYADLNLEASDIPQTIIADITDCRATIPDSSFDVVFSSDVFEHIDRPWLAAREIARILKPGGLAITWTLFSWRNHPCPVDYWRYSAECLEFLFGDLDLLEKGYDLSDRRKDQPGFWGSGMDSVPVDQFGGWRENWAVYHVGRKGPGPAVPPFRSSDHPSARFLRMDTQGTVTNPRLLDQEPPAGITVGAQQRLVGSAKRVEAAQTAVASGVADLTEEVRALSARLDRLAGVVANPPPTDLQRVARRLRRLSRKRPGPTARR
ncbi:class I SAM-dependent methyltransferase [uncultured Friedmanniella sp.]|uniref:class I SAM-dependent methyltransferase n=1 Tax=uncultured Friedmanniella sp. TaxID=335381 RepID=UPI0035CC2658